MYSVQKFQKIIRDYYRQNGRNLPWRRTRDPYRILVSEIMLQQTQVARVEGFYEKFIKQFPDFQALGKARTADVLRAWQGLGYNRRALALQRLAKIVVKSYDGELPKERRALESLPGVGPYTAGAIRAFAFDEPDIFIETNIRRLFIHFFFPRRRKVKDDEIKTLLEGAICHLPFAIRHFYYALMDYGAMLGATEKKNPNRRSAHYAKQSKFTGSDRELRGKILRLILERKRIPNEELAEIFPIPKIRLAKITDGMAKEGFISKTGLFLSQI
ncbi:MAG: A/G-specific adenine glycosylase [Patescibacteria group bacterium]|nr:A/G-specific adenine glycosylase [Patescibacteria group bacterium]